MGCVEGEDLHAHRAEVVYTTTTAHEKPLIKQTTQHNTQPTVGIAI